ncbi:hypothetical protein PF005_g24735 [Phytophthora fragariae]|uniref:Uncharacterized protein n=1 Tax=Phytophthora fragariae TaxID=53985 RepID=A0A6A3W446_9STRA|nr:hypothetical protein PF003_g4366 [Phytophthora fragariae]KAE8948289.1 hypothetical protein PF009_g2125 [Phytophthora fragariae]KAE8977492.1 hypothetical protein PF011_g23627 [Phytophthora fragariae]KAE9076198.1 hypothetical protein PF007_g24722 [Phytophthora fragariae]KAE9095435.1 hypothetical protein PF006_g24013 [Phytophthora fragariae]
MDKFCKAAEYKNNPKRVQADGITWTKSETSMKLDLKERDLFNEDEIKQMKLRKQIEKNNPGLSRPYARIGPIEPKNSIPVDNL